MIDFRKYGEATYAWIGILAVTIMVVSVMLCLMLADDWDYAKSSLCDFGISENKMASWLFIGACAVSGAMFIMSGFGWFLFEESKYVRNGGVMIMASGLTLIFVGLVDNSMSFHMAVAAIFAALFMIGIALVSIQDIIDRHYLMVTGLAIVGLYSLSTIFVSVLPYSMNQVIMVGFAFFWFIVRSLKFKDLREFKETTLA